MQVLSKDGKGFLCMQLLLKQMLLLLLLLFIYLFIYFNIYIKYKKSNLSVGFGVASKGLTSRLQMAHC